jgi:hypothetical protein
VETTRLLLSLCWGPHIRHRLPLGAHAGHDYRAAQHRVGRLLPLAPPIYCHPRSPPSGLPEPPLSSSCDGAFFGAGPSREPAAPAVYGLPHRSRVASCRVRAGVAAGQRPERRSMSARGGYRSFSVTRRPFPSPRRLPHQSRPTPSQCTAAGQRHLRPHCRARSPPCPIPPVRPPPPFFFCRLPASERRRRHNETPLLLQLPFSFFTCSPADMCPSAPSLACIRTRPSVAARPSVGLPCSLALRSAKPRPARGRYRPSSLLTARLHDPTSKLQQASLPTRFGPVADATAILAGPRSG